jgi:ubiquinone/menaquinone biosynthesis C-methylase UbiE/thioredoxin-like negative regulator of GroEL
LKRGDFPAFEQGFLAALEQDPLNLDGWLELAEAYIAAKRPQGTLMAVQAVLQANPNTARAYQLMSQAFEALGDQGKAVAALDKADQVQPSTETAYALAQKFLSLDLPGRSIPYLQRLVNSHPGDRKYRQQLALALMMFGKAAEAAALFQELLLSDRTNRQLALFYSMAMKPVTFSAFSHANREAIELVMAMPDINHQMIAAPALSLLHLDPQFAALKTSPAQLSPDDDGLHALITSTFFLHCISRLKLRDAALEHWLTAMRRRFLLDWQGNSALLEQAGDFLAALAIACWFNEYVFAEDDEERAAIVFLKEKVQGQKAGPLAALYGCYAPLTDMGVDAKGTNGFWAELKDAQITHPKEERKLGDAIPAFAPIADATGEAVKAMYEERPYPRWRQPVSFSDKGLHGFAGSGSNLLIGGCGTGQEIVNFCANLPQLKVTAIDLSRASLGYARRQIERVGLLNRVTFKQGDLQNVAALDTTFDLVTSSGVLHHLRDPDKGLKALLSVLAPNGRMHIALYAQHARHHYLQAAIDLAKAKGVGQGIDGMRAYRQEIMALPAEHPASRVAGLMDFYTLNECTDLLFHIQECWYTLPQLKELLDSNELELTAFKIPQQRRQQYLKLNPNDRAHIDWATLQAFEAEADPDTFIGMYDFWVKRKGDTAPHPLDAAITRHMI